MALSAFLSRLFREVWGQRDGLTLYNEISNAIDGVGGDGSWEGETIVASTSVTAPLFQSNAGVADFSFDSDGSEATLLLLGDAGTNIQLSATANAITETVTNATGEYTKTLTDNLADAYSTLILSGNVLTKYVTTNNAEGFQVVTRLLGSQGADVASASTILLGVGNYANVTGTTTINLITTTGWTAGSVVVLRFTASLTVNHNTADSGADHGILLAGAANFSATANDTLTLMLDSAGKWSEIARAAI